jgi:predicted Zn-dependent protease
MKKNLLCVLFISLVLISCQTVPITGRQQLSLVSSGELYEMSYKSYNDFLSQHSTIKGSNQAQEVTRVGKNIQTAVESYFAERKMSSLLEGYKWEFNLVDDDTINAWCMPGGKVVVYTGILPVTKDENGLAVVMGHEIAHAVANHGRERMSQSLLVEMGGAALSTALSSNPEGTQNIFLTAYGLGSEVGLMLPYGRLHESEADRLGLIFMAMAGYDPHHAPEFWTRMASKKDKAGSAVPEFLSTHPSDATRIEKIKESLPEAMEYYKGK